MCRIAFRESLGTLEPLPHVMPHKKSAGPMFETDKCRLGLLFLAFSQFRQRFGHFGITPRHDLLIQQRRLHGRVT